MRTSVRIAAPAVLAVLALAVGLVFQATPTESADFENADVTRVSESFITLPGTPFGTTTVKMGPSETLPFLLTANTNAPFPKTGQLLIYNYDDVAKDGIKIEVELITYNNNDSGCGPPLAVGEFCITARAKKGTSAQQHKQGSIIKLAAQLQSKITAGATPPFEITVSSTAGFTPTTGDTILIDNELFTVTVVNATTWNVTARAGATIANGPTTTAAQHSVGAIATSPDIYLHSLSRQIHDTGDNSIDTRSKTYITTQPGPLLPDPIPYTAAAAVQLLGSYNPSTGVVTQSTGGCVPVAGSDPPAATQTSVTIQFVKGDPPPLTQNVGAINIKLDTEEPLDCVDSPEATGPVHVDPLEYGANASHDSDDDGCSNWNELGTNEADGGLRDPYNPGDWYDPTGPANVPDGTVDLFNDVFGVAGHFGEGTGDPGYEARFDRGPLLAGGGSWNITPADGAIDLFNDIFGVAGQFGHTCA